MFKFFLPVISMIALLLGGCSGKKESLFAPKSIKDTKISFLSTTVSKTGPDNFLENNSVVYHFNKNGTYSSYFNGDPYQFGDYSYYKKNLKTAQVAISYSEQKEANTYVFLMDFSSKTTGSWKTTYISETSIGHGEAGTFTILKRNKDL